jgi:hypothetical protein
MCVRKGALVATTLVLSLVATSMPVSASTNWHISLAAGSRGEAHATSLATPTGGAGTCVSPTGATIRVTWSATTHATRYTLYDSTTSSSSGFAVVAASVAGTSWTSGSLAAATYWFKVTAHVGRWTSSQSASSAPRVITSVPDCS